jgi:hypothetical protein
MTSECFKSGTPDPEVHADCATRESGQELCRFCGRAVWPHELNRCVTCHQVGCLSCVKSAKIELLTLDFWVRVCGDECLADEIGEEMKRQGKLASETQDLLATQLDGLNRKMKGDPT